MTETIPIEHQENKIFDGTEKNDVVPIQQSTMATKEPSGPNTYNDYSLLIGNCGAGGVSALSLNDKNTSPTTVNTFESVSDKMITDNKSTNNENIIDNASNISAINHGENNLNKKNINGNGNGNHVKSRRRRKKSKQMTNSKPYKKSNWKFHSSRPRNSSRRNNGYGLSTLVPYNTNRFLMEEHMPEITSPTGGRYRDSSFSIDSEENLYDEEEFLSKEFSNVYESARSERLDEMTKEQLIQEYLQLEANYDKLSNSLRARKNGDGGNTSDSQQNECDESETKVKKLEDRIKELTAENLELRRQMADIRSRERRSRSNSRHRYTNYAQTKKNSHRHHNGSQSSQKPNRTNKNNTNNNHNSSSCYSEDSESDSSSSSSSDSDSSSSFSSCRTSSCNSKSSFTDAENNMSGINDDDNDDTHLLLNGCAEMGDSDALKSKTKEEILQLQ